jgi:Arc/MetJ family transcription regulator
MARTTIILNDELLEQAKRITGEVKTSRVVNKALEEMVRRERVKDIIALKGSGIIELSNEEIEELRDK